MSLNLNLFNANCFDVFEILEKRIENNTMKKINLVFVDLPYGQVDCAWDSKIDLDKMWDALSKICKDSCVYVFTCTTKFGYSIINSKFKWFRYDLVWMKTNSVGFLNAKLKPLIKHEMIYVFKKPGSKLTYNPQMTVGKPYKKSKKKYYVEIYSFTDKGEGKINTGTRYPTSLLEFKYDKIKYHRTQKPLDLCKWIINTYSNVNDVVIDFCMGSGSAGCACKDLGREFYGVELNEKIYDIAIKRLEEH